MLAIGNKIFLVTRAKDWRLSFVPFIIGCVYLWLWWFEIRFSVAAVLLFVFSLITTVGFASLGYFINEFFDKNVDAKAGKINVLGKLPVLHQVGLFLGCAALTFLPWIWLPKGNVTFILIAIEILFFLLYSLPFPRLKNVPFVSGFVDSGYAYVIPLTLSFYTYVLFAHGVIPFMFYSFLISVFLIGFRNITIHHVNDIFKDIRSGTRTLPQIIGINKTNKLVAALLVFEILFVLAWSIQITWAKPLFFIWIISFITFLFIRAKFLSSSIKFEYFSIEPIRHLTDPAYQYVFPAVCLVLAITVDLKWIIIAPFHFALFLTKPMQVIAWETVYWKTIQLKYAGIRTFTIVVIMPSSLVVNYIIFFSFLLLGINLRKEKKNALMVLKEKFGNK
jgi:4-hydroxybenzoate polyprenyltransferase